MSFFDNLGKKISDASRSAVEKTKDLAEIARLNSMIKENETQLDALYTELGEAFYNSHCNDKEPEFINDIKKISALIRETDECRESVLDLKGLAKCPYCGAEFSSDETRCPECGKAVPRTAKKITGSDGDRLICSVCGYHMRPGSNFCIMCGTPVKKDVEETAEKTDEIKAKASETSPAPSVYTDEPKKNVNADNAGEPEAERALKSYHAQTSPSLGQTPPLTEKTADDGIFDTPIEDITQSFQISKTEPTLRSEKAAVSTAPQDVSSDEGLDETAAKAAAEISRMTAEKLAARKTQSDIAFSHKNTHDFHSSARESTENAHKPSASDDGIMTDLPDFDAIDDSLVVEEQTISDAPSEDVAFTPRRSVSRPTVNGSKCSKCGALLPDRALFCTKCGTPCKAEKKTPPVCPGCGAFVNAGMTFCPECGMKLV